MTINAFEDSLKESVDFLIKVGLFGAKGTKKVNTDGVSIDFKNASQKANYHLVYQAAVRNMDYDFTLEDKSIFQFSYKYKPATQVVPDVRFAFFQNPKNFISYKEFLDLQRGLNLIDESDEEIGELYIEEYEQFLDEEQLNLSSTTIRYDIDSKNYNPLIHSTSHIHIGHLNNVRIPCDKVLTPLKFVLFVIKHVYYHKWKEIIESNDESYNSVIKTAKNSCSNLGVTNWKVHEFGIHENRELYLT